jgi:acetyl esterase
MKIGKLATLATVSAMAFILNGTPHDASAAQTVTTRTTTVTNTITPLANPDAKADPDMARILAALKSLHGKPIQNLSADEARKQPGIATAVKQVMKDENIDPDSLPIMKDVTVQDTSYGGAHGTEAARIYTPKMHARFPLPVIAYFHGGGWVLASLDTYDASARALALKTGAIVVSFEYRHAPEDKFPAAHEDAFNAYRWILANAHEFDGDAHNVAVAGESAGGNLAANVAIMARDQHVEMPVHMLLVYPVAGTNMRTRSYIENANAKPLNRAMMKWFFMQTTEDMSQLQDPRLDLVHADLRGLPSATVITDGIDPLMSEGKMLASELQQAGSAVDYRNYPGETHEFFGTAAVNGVADKAQDIAADDLRSAFVRHIRMHKEWMREHGMMHSDMND